MPTVWAVHFHNFMTKGEKAMEHKNWTGFNGGDWQNSINVRDFIQKNYTEYRDDASFLSGATDRTNELMKKVNLLFSL